MDHVQSDHPDQQPPSQGKRPADPTVVDATVVEGGHSVTTTRMPKTIGKFRIKSPIGSGGMGTVYLAQQDSPKRDVAVKVMNTGVVSPKALRRFEFEAQTLGKLQHPAIAQIYEAGTFDDGSGGRPFFAMEYVSSARELGDYVTDKKLDTRQRLELFRAACEGVEYGHRRGVIHRDLKPGNILVDADAHPKIIDFGVARSTDSDAASATLATEAGQLIGTLQYMSPEQVELDPADLDTRSDVYALGVILYQLLVDELPYDLTNTSLTKAAELIKETQPARLSEINKNLKGDLETICLKALEKDREQRYQTVNDLAEDIRRYLADEPIMARPPTTAEQLRRFVRKNKAASIATAVVVLALIAATVISIVFSVEASRQRDQAEQARVEASNQRDEASKQRDAAQLAKQEADNQRTIAEQKTAEVEKKAGELQAMADFQAQQLSGIDVPAMGASLKSNILEELQLEPTDVSGADFTGTALQLLNKHIFERTFDAIDTKFSDQPLVQAQLLQTMASTLRDLGLLADATAPQTQALELRVAELGREDPATLESIAAMGELLQIQGKRDEALLLYTEALETRRRILGDEHPDTLESTARMGGILHKQAKYDEALPYLTKALETRRRILGNEHPDTLYSIGAMGNLLIRKNKYDEAMVYYQEDLETCRRIFGDEHPSTHAAISAMGNLLQVQGKYDEAMVYYQEDLELSRRVLGNEHPDTLWTINAMANLLQLQRRFDEAMPYQKEALEGRRRTLGNEHPSTLTSIGAMGVLLKRQGKYDEAMPYYVEALDTKRRILGNEHPSTLNANNNMGVLLKTQGKYDEAMPYYVEALETRRRTFGPDHHQTMIVTYNLGLLLFDKGEHQEAMSYLTEAIDGLRRALGDSHPITLKCIGHMVKLHDAWHEAEPDAGHDATAAEYRAQLEDLTQKDQENVTTVVP